MAEPIVNRECSIYSECIMPSSIGGEGVANKLSNLVAEGKHKLAMSLVSTAPYSREAQRTNDASHTVYHRYQKKVHGDTEEKCGATHWKNFLTDSSFMVRNFPNNNDDLREHAIQYHMSCDVMTVIGMELSL